MVDVVYFLTEKAHYSHMELLFSLRSLEKYVTGWRRVWIVGPEPVWNYLNLHRLRAGDPFTHNKDANIIRKMHLCCRSAELSDPFLFVNDDHYFSQFVKALHFPFYYKGTLPEHDDRREYGRKLVNTRRVLLANRRPIYHFDIHAPIVIKKQPFLKSFEGLDWIDADGPGLVMKSVYGNSCRDIIDRRRYLKDLKVSLKTARGTALALISQIRERPCWSTADYMPPLVWQVLNEMYPEPSRFEVPPKC